MTPSSHKNRGIGKAGWLALAALLLSACASTPQYADDTADLADCRRLYSQIDELVAEAGVRDAAATRIPGFPYLRSTRFLASFAEELQPEQWPRWMEHLRERDLQARQFELLNAGLPLVSLSKLDACGQHWLQRDLADAPRREALRLAVAVPDDYSWLARFLGAYPLAAPFLKSGIEGFRAEVRKTFARPLEAIERQGRLRLWSAAKPARPSAELSTVTMEPDALGVPQLSRSQWDELLARHAPGFLIDSRGDFDLPGSPAWEQGERSFKAEPVIYQDIAFTRFYGRVLPQLIYTIWFAERPPEGPLDSYAGYLDGVMWRVTLDETFKPLVYDSAHACGCYHYVFPARHMKPRLDHSPWQEVALQPQGVVPWQAPVLWLSSGAHYLQRVLPDALAQDLAEGKVQTLSPRDYSQLRALARAAGGSRSLFAEDGLVPGTQRLERYWLWPTGVPDPGAMRQYGRHATAFIGREHFDAAFLLERWFLPPEAMSRAD